MPREDYLTPEFTVHAEALVRGIYAIAGRSRRVSRADPNAASNTMNFVTWLLPVLRVAILCPPNTDVTVSAI